MLLVASFITIILQIQLHSDTVIDNITIWLSKFPVEENELDAKAYDVRIGNEVPSLGENGGIINTNTLCGSFNDGRCLLQIYYELPTKCNFDLLGNWLSVIHVCCIYS